MKCPYRKVIIHEEKKNFRPAKDVEEFAECYGEECPLYFYNSMLDAEYCGNIKKRCRNKEVEE